MESSGLTTITMLSSLASTNAQPDIIASWRDEVEDNIITLPEMIWIESKRNDYKNPYVEYSGFYKGFFVIHRGRQRTGLHWGGLQRHSSQMQWYINLGWILNLKKTKSHSPHWAPHTAWGLLGALSPLLSLPLPCLHSLSLIINK